MSSVKNWIAQGFYSNRDVGKRLEMEGFTFAVLSRGFRPTFADFRLDFAKPLKFKLETTFKLRSVATVNLLLDVAHLTRPVILTT